MSIIIKNGNVISGGTTQVCDILITDGRIGRIASDISGDEADKVIDCSDKLVMPGLIDVHVHFREPGFEYKETIATGSAAAAAGGFTTVCTMPNLDPSPWDLKGLGPQLDAIEKDAAVHVLPYGRITRNGQEVADLEGMAPYVFAYSDDGVGVQQDDLMEQAMVRAKSLGKVIVAHSEDTRYAPEDPRSEYKQVERDLELVAKTGCSYHVCHVSTKESLELIAQGKTSGLDVTCETAPHYLVFSRPEIDEKIALLGEETGGRFKMNPPLRGADDKVALLKAVADGTVDMIATDHAPHSAEEKAKGFDKSLNGILGLETAFPVMYTALVKEGVITKERLVELMSTNPAGRFSLDSGELKEGAPADITIAGTDESFLIDPETFKSKGRSTPFEGMEVSGRILYTICSGKTVFQK